MDGLASPTKTAADPPPAQESRTCVILQPSYLPWRGYFHQIIKADLFVFYDDAQYDRRGWRNRNTIKTAAGSRWLTVPVFAKGAQVEHTPIREIEIDWSQPWARKHRESIRHAYRKAPFHDWYAARLDEFFERRPRYLADLTIGLTIDLATDLGITGTRFLRSSDLPAEGRKTDRLLSILRHVGATRYLSGPSARDYIEADKFAEAGISLEYMVYDYPDYPQLHGPFNPFVSIVDLILMTGPDAPAFIADR
jgi:hypothetical protein